MTELDDVDVDVEEPSTSWREIAREQLETRLGNAVVGLLGLLAYLVFGNLAVYLHGKGVAQFVVDAAALTATVSLGLGIIFLGGAAIATVKATV